LKAFNSGGYKFQAGLSDDTIWTFTRKQPPPPGKAKVSK